MEKLTIEAVESDDLTDRDFIGIHEVMQDMWASEEWMGELAQCADCRAMISKEQIFWHLPPGLFDETVAYIMKVLWIDAIACPLCWGYTRLIYGPENVEKIKERVLGSVDSFLVLCKSATKGIVGFEEGYIDPLDRMFELDFKDHYEDVWLGEIERRIETILGYVPNEMLLTSSLGLLKPYRNFRNLFGIMSQFARILPNTHLWKPGITELDQGGVTHRMSEGINQGVSLGIENVPDLQRKVRLRAGRVFNSNLVVYPDYAGMLKKNFDMGHREFLGMLRGKSKTGKVGNNHHTSLATASV